MIRNPKAKGSRLERKTVKLLEALGYRCIRAAGSLGPFDLVAVNSQGCRFIQVKANTWPGPAERESLREAARALPPGSLVECWRWNDRARYPLVRLLEEF